MPLNKFSREITQKKHQGASQAMLYATGFKEQDMEKAQIGIVSHWYEGNPCNMHLGDLAKEVKDGVAETGLIGLSFNTIGVSDGISMGTSGMSYSLPSREVIADSIETVMKAQWYDGCVSVPGCDKNMPGNMIAFARVNRPAIMVYGGSISPGSRKPGERLDIVSAFQSYGAYLSGKIDDAERKSIIKKSCPGAGACGGMYTANTMASAIEAMGMTLPYSSSTPATSPLKKEECLQAGKAIKKLLELDLKPLDILTRKAFENAITLAIALGGSTNVVLHLLAIARSCKVSLSLEDFQTISDNTPYLADLKPSGQYLMHDLHEVGGTPAVLKLLLEKNLIHGDIMTVTGKTLEVNLKDLPGLSDGQKVIKPYKSPMAEKGHLKILRGNLAPEGAVAKITGKEGSFFNGPAKVFDSEALMLKALEIGEIKPGQVIIIRYVGPKGGPGMPEMLTPTSAIVGAGLANDVALITDGRFSGGSHGFIVGHCTPEAQIGGPIALVKDGDEISIDAGELNISVNISAQEFAQRRKTWKPKPQEKLTGTLAKFAKLVSSASEGCVTDEVE
ncbi:MAG: dihydroxy-acid dehydratase [Oligoflexales bacterium]